MLTDNGSRASLTASPGRLSERSPKDSFVRASRPIAACRAKRLSKTPPGLAPPVKAVLNRPDLLLDLALRIGEDGLELD